MAMKTTRELKGVGLSIPRPDGPEKVTGQVQYVADLKPRGLLHAKLLRSPYAHARILRIDATRARALPGVRAVLTASDVPELKRQAPTRAHAVLAIDRAIFAGQPVAAVAAEEDRFHRDVKRYTVFRVPCSGSLQIPERSELLQILAVACGRGGGLRQDSIAVRADGRGLERARGEESRRRAAGGTQAPRRRPPWIVGVTAGRRVPQTCQIERDAKQTCGHSRLAPSFRPAPELSQRTR